MKAFPMCSTLILLLAATPGVGTAQNVKDEMRFEEADALRVVRAGNREPIYLHRPVTVRIGDRPFLGGVKVSSGVSVYVPTSDIDLIERFPSVDALKKVYKDAAPAVAVPPAAEGPKARGKRVAPKAGVESVTTDDGSDPPSGAAGRQGDTPSTPRGRRAVVGAVPLGLGERR